VSSNGSEKKVVSPWSSNAFYSGASGVRTSSTDRKVDGQFDRSRVICAEHAKAQSVFAIDATAV